jgi:hypothetical protein
LTAIENKGNRVYVTEEIQFKLSKLKKQKRDRHHRNPNAERPRDSAETEGDEENRYQVRDFYLPDAASSSLGSISGRSALLAAPPHLVSDPVKSATRRETNRDCPVRVSLTINSLSYS